MKRVFLSLFLILFLFLSTTLPVISASKIQYYEAEVTGSTIVESSAVIEQNIQQLRIKITSGDLKDNSYTVQTFDTRNQYKKGDGIVVSYEQLAGNKENIQVVDIVRRPSIMTLFFIFLIFVFVVGRWRGFTSFIGLAVSFVVIIRLVVPQILIGNDPILISLLAAVLIIPLTFFLSHGLQEKTVIAIVGTFVSLLLTGILAYIFVEFTKLTGFASEEAAYLQFTQGGAINIKGLLLAGILIGAMGILDDITISQASVVEELHKANPKMSFGQLYKKGMTVGRDHIASLVNTLVLVYTGASLPLFLLFTNANMSYLTVINQELFATEIVRTLVSSIGVIAAVPLTTLLASYRKRGN